MGQHAGSRQRFTTPYIRSSFRIECNAALRVSAFERQWIRRSSCCCSVAAPHQKHITPTLSKIYTLTIYVGSDIPNCKLEWLLCRCYCVEWWNNNSLNKKGLAQCDTHSKPHAFKAHESTFHGSSVLLYHPSLGCMMCTLGQPHTMSPSATCLAAPYARLVRYMDVQASESVVSGRFHNWQSWPTARGYALGCNNCQGTSQNTVR